MSCREQSTVQSTVLLLAPCPFLPLQLLHDTPGPRHSWMPAQVCNVPHSWLQVRHKSQLHLSSLSSSSAVSFALRPFVAGGTKVAWSVLGLAGMRQFSLWEGGQVSIQVPRVIL